MLETEPSCIWGLCCRCCSSKDIRGVFQHLCYTLTSIFVHLHPWFSTKWHRLLFRKVVKEYHLFRPLAALVPGRFRWRFELNQTSRYWITLITLANQKGRKQSSKPIKTPSNYIISGSHNEDIDKTREYVKYRICHRANETASHSGCPKLTQLENKKWHGNVVRVLHWDLA